METSRYIDLSSDAGFKITFGDPANKHLLIGLLNSIITERVIVDIEYLESEIRPEDVNDKRVRFDIRCKEKDGTSFLVEMQKNEYDYLVDRLIVYAGDPLKRMLKAGQGYDEVKPLYVICIANFIFSFNKDEPLEVRNKLIRRAKLMMTDSGKVLSDTLNFIFLQLPVIESLSEEQILLDKQAYTIRNISGMSEKPKLLSEPYFDNLFEAADKRTMDRNKLKLYDNMIRDEIQIKAEKDFAVRKAMQEGIEKGIKRGIEQGIQKGSHDANLSSARNLLSAGVDIETISRCTGLSIEEINGTGRQ